MEYNHQYKIQNQMTNPTNKGSDKVSENEITPTENEQKVDSSEKSFIRGLIDRGEAAKLKDGKLPPGVTHEIVKENDNDVPTLRRHRFSSF